jgi:Predicted Zn-dependent peptidases, insulinase-like
VISMRNRLILHGRSSSRLQK